MTTENAGYLATMRDNAEEGLRAEREARKAVEIKATRLAWKLKQAQAVARASRTVVEAAERLTLGKSPDDGVSAYDWSALVDTIKRYRRVFSA